MTGDYLTSTFLPALRLLVLRLLFEQVSEEANDSLLVAGVQATRELAASADQVRQACDWLAEAGLVEREDLGRFRLYRLLERGRDFMARRVRVDGIARPER